MRLTAGQTIAFQMSQCLGDSLLAMIVVNNLARNGYRVVVFGDYIHALKDWFPSFEIHPTVKPEHAHEVLGRFDVLLHAYPRNVVEGTREWHPQCLVMDEWPTFRQTRNMVEIHVDICQAGPGPRRCRAGQRTGCARSSAASGSLETGRDSSNGEPAQEDVASEALPGACPATPKQ